MRLKAVLAAGLAAGCCASAAETAVTRGEPVIVTATRIPQRPSDSIQPAIVITREEIAASGHHSLAELLGARAGLEITLSGGLGQPSAVFVRGTEARHTMVLIDGLRVGSATNGGTAFENIPLNQIERVEIVRGPLSSLYGSDAIGGVIQIFTRRGRDGAGARIGAGSFGTRELSGSYGRYADRNEFALSAGALESSGFDATRPSIPFGQHHPDADSYRNRNLSGRWDRDLGAGHALGVAAFSSEGTTHFDAGAATDDVNRQVLQAFSLTSRNRITEAWSSLLRLGTSRDDSSSRGAFPGYFQTDQHQATWQNEIALAAGTLLGGLEYLDQRVASHTLFKQTGRTIRSAFAGYGGRLGAHGLQLNARHDDNDQFGAHNTGSAGYSYRASPAWRLRAGAGTAFKAPTFNDLYFPDLAPFFFSNPGLRPERSRTREVGAIYERAGARFDATLFDTRITDLITVFTDPATFVSTTRNLSRARIEGVELAFRGSWPGWQARAQLTLQDPRDEATGAQLRRRARRHGSLAVDRNSGPWRLGAELTGSGERFDSTSEAPNTRLHGYALVHLTAGYALSRDWTASLRWHNAFDRDYETVQFFRSRGSSVFAWLAWQPR
jgi:vitamin B12 transporter